MVGVRVVFYNLVVGLGSVIFGLLLFIAPAFGKPEISRIFSIYGMGVFLVGFGCVILMQALPVVSAKHVRNLIRKLKAEVKTSE